MRQWMISRWNGYQLELNVVTAGSLHDALCQSKCGSHDPQIVKIKAVTPAEEGGYQKNEVATAET